MKPYMSLGMHFDYFISVFPYCGAIDTCLSPKL